MKKVSFVVSIVLLASFVLAACGGGNNGTENTPGTSNTPGSGALPTSAVLNTPTMMATVPAEATSTSDASAATSTPVAVATGTPVTSLDMSKSPDRLSSLLDYDVRNTSGTVIGKVNGLLVSRTNLMSEDTADNNSTGMATNTPGTAGSGSTAATATPGTGSTAATATPAAGSTAATAAPSTGTSSTAGAGATSAQLMYVVVELNNDFNNTTGSTGSSGSTGSTAATATPGTGTGSTAATATPAAGAVGSTTPTTSGMTGSSDTMLGAGDELLVPLAAFETLMVGDARMSSTTGSSDNPALALKIDDQALASAPVFDRDSLDFTAATWADQFQAFWSGQGFGIPVTGDAQDNMAGAGMQTVLFEDGFGPIDATNPNEEDLGEVEDFIIDPATGQFNYTVLATGGFLGLGEKYVLLPMQLVSWVVDDNAATDRDIKDLGKVMINLPEDALKTAPTFDSLKDLDTSAAGWDSDIQSFWKTYSPGTK